MLIDIALDAVGTDKAPEAEIRGAILACRALPVRVHLIGPEAELRDLLDEHFPEAESKRQMETAINWGLYADILRYDASSDQLSLAQPDAAAAAGGRA